MTSAIMILMVAVVVILVLVIASQRSGPRVTHIETHREDRKDGDDA